METMTDMHETPQPNGEDGDDEILDEATRQRAEELRQQAEEATRRIPPAFFEMVKVQQQWQQRNNGVLELVQRQAQENARLFQAHRDLLQNATRLIDFKYFSKLLETLPKPMADLDAALRSAGPNLDLLLRPTLLEQQISALLSSTLVSLGNAPGLAGLHRLPRLLYPANWGTLADDPADISAAVSIMRDEGIPLTRK
jgi:AcrR family transcriptional regulator